VPTGENGLSTSRRDFLVGSLAVAGGLALQPGERSEAAPTTAMEYDIVIYGGTSAAITAAVQAKRMGKSVVIVSPDQHLGGLTTSGLGWTDSKNGNAIGGLAREFYQRVWKFYQNPAAWTLQTRESYLAQRVGAQPGPAIDEAKKVMWTFEPKAAERVVEEWLSETGIPVFRNEWLDRKNGVVKQGKTITAIKTLSGKTYKGKMFIDAGYEGDLMAASGVKYRVGRDSQKEFDEPLNGIRFPIKGIDRYGGGNEFAGISPYIVPNDPKSGLIAGLEQEYKGDFPIGDADPIRLQCFNYRLCLTKTAKNRVAFPKPDGYDEKMFELLFRVVATGADCSFTTQAMPNRKTDSNAQGKISSDYVGGSFSVKDGWTYSEASYERRKRVLEEHRLYHQGLLWSLQNHPRVPEKNRKELADWGLSKDEFVDNNNWPYQIYVREARRMEGLAMVTQHHVQLKRGFEVKDSIGCGSYSLDSHVVRRIVLNGAIRNEGGFYIWWDRPYPLPYGCLVPRKGDVTNLFAPTTLSATHAAFGSIRMEPTYMILGQASATAAALAIDAKVAVQDVDYPTLQKRLIADGQILELNVPGTPDFKK
jgi:hypothetical protein